MARGVNPRRNLDKKGTGMVEYNKDLRACVISDVLVIDGIRPEKPKNEIEGDGLSTEMAFSGKGIGGVALTSGLRGGTTGN